MTKTHHPQSRADRLLLKQKLDETKKTRHKASKARRVLKETLKDRETLHDLKELTEAYQ